MKQPYITTVLITDTDVDYLLLICHVDDDTCS